jgi:hypothetical protein
MHNKGLDYTLQRLAEEHRRDWDADGVWQIVEEYVRAQEDSPVLLGGRGTAIEYRSLARIGNGGRGVYFDYLDSLSNAGAVSDGFVVLARSLYDLAERGRRAELAGMARDVNISGLEPHEATILLSAISVAEHSIDYWSYDPHSGNLQGTMLVHPVVAADVVGGVVGGVSTWWNGRYTGHSDWVDIAGGALIGALGTSTLGYLRIG